MSLNRTADAVAALAASALTAHTDAPDPHPQYARAVDGAIRLSIVTTDPAPPAAGALLYAFDTGLGLELRLIDSLGAVTTIGP